MAHYSPLRYPGGKNKMYSYTTALLEKNGLIGYSYAEPFAGGSGLALSLLINKKVSSLLLNDLDRSIYAFWHSVLNQTGELCHLIEITPVTLEEWYSQKKVQQKKDNASLLDLGFSTFFLNRTNISGIIAGGPIGGYNQAGQYKLDCRFNKKNLIQRIKKISTYKNSISFFNLDAKEFIKTIITRENNIFTFIDPPYFNKGPSLYMNYLSENDHKELANLIKKDVNSPFIVTYDNSSEIKEMYKPLKAEEFAISYSANRKGIFKEIRFLKNIS